MGIAIGAKHASVVWRVSVSRRVRYGRFHCIRRARLWTWAGHAVISWTFDLCFLKPTISYCTVMLRTVVFSSIFALAAAVRCDNMSRSDIPHEYCVDGSLIGVVTSVRVVVGITCCLSMIGAVLIILSYVLIKDIRTKSRKILLHISLMDFMVAAGNIVGILVNFDDYLYGLEPHTYTVINNACKAQACINVYSTLSSILWTNCLAVYIYIQNMLMGQSKVKWTMYVFFIISYGLPFIVAIWYVLTGKLGYAPQGRI